MDEAEKLMGLLGQAPDTQLDKAWSKKCREYNKERDGDTGYFLRDLRDVCVFTGGASTAVMQFLNAMVDKFTTTPPTQEEEEIRKSDLHARWLV